MYKFFFFFVFDLQMLAGFSLFISTVAAEKVFLIV